MTIGNCAGKFQCLKGVTWSECDGGEREEVGRDVVVRTPGVYGIRYQCTDKVGNSVAKCRTITTLESECVILVLC